MIVAPALARPVFHHLHRLTDSRGLFEHALLAEPRREHGYCVDDVARALVVLCREQGRSLERQVEHYLEFTLAAVQPDGRCHNRMAVDGEWTDTPTVEDCWGRAVWGLGVAAAKAPSARLRHRALVGFRRAAAQRSPYLHAMAFAALGAGVLLQSRPDEPAARDLLRDAVSQIGVTSPDRAWPWPQDRLRYANGAIVEALLLGGAALPDRAAAAHGLALLTFLLDIETHTGQLSVTPVGGRSATDRGPGFDQQPIEVAALADACATAYELTGGPRWLAGVQMAWEWFLGANDSGTLMFDPETGGGYDGLHAHGPNLNQGAESTLALLSTTQHARRFELPA
ncbi:MAG: hypothetical protein QOE99_479 [Actinomycetota bacterium]|nr:hypothetical protein [Actinomycetota bacterium]